jgi:hypothetical protein
MAGSPLTKQTKGAEMSTATTCATGAGRLTGAARRLRALFRDRTGSQITDNLGLIVIGVVAIVAIGGLISGLDKAVFGWVTTQLGLG